MKSRTANSCRRKRLKLELLENRSLLTGAPWMFFDHIEFEVIDFNSGEGEAADDATCNHGKRGDSDRITLALMMVGESDNSLDDLASGEDAADAGQESDLPTSLDPGMGESVGSMPDGSNLDGNMDLVGSGEGPGDMEMSPPSPEHVIAFNSPQEALIAMTGDMLQPEGEAISPATVDGGEVMFPPSSNLATPLVESDDAVLFDVAQATTKTDPATSFLSDPFQYSGTNSQSGVTLDSEAARNSRFDLALQGLEETLQVKEASEQYSESELEQLLDTLSTGDQAIDSAPVPQPESVGESEIREPKVEQELLAEELEQAGGMIALNLPQDLLIDDQSFGTEKDQATAWTSRVGIYRDHEMNSARGGAAAQTGPANTALASLLNSEQQKSDEVADSRLRPIAAATSVAFGAIYIGMKRQRDKERELDKANRKLQ